jgi:hypothetical protein
MFKNLFKHVPSENFKLPMKDFKSIGTHAVNGELYEVFKHTDSRLQIMVHVDSLKVEFVKVGRFNL